MSETAAEMIRKGMHPGEATTLDRDDAIKLIREALKKRSGKTWSVTGGRGTGWGWITIMSPPARRVAHDLNPDYHRDDPKPGAPSHFENADAPKDRRWYMSEADSIELAELLGLARPVHCQGENIPAASDYRRFYVARALGLEATDNPTPYWD